MATSVRQLPALEIATGGGLEKVELDPMEGTMKMGVLGLMRATGAEMLAYEYYRLYLPLREVGKHDNGIAAVLVSEDIQDGMMEMFDVVAMSRMYCDDSAGAINAIHEAGAQIVFDADDDLTEDVRWLEGHGYLFKEMLGLVDHVTCTTPHLASVLGKYTQRLPVVIPNYVDAGWLQFSATESPWFLPGLVIGYSGTWTHYADWRCTQGALAGVAELPRVQPVVLGECPHYLQDIPGLVSIGKQPYAKYPGPLSLFDVLLCSLDVQDEWNWGKSAVKPLEAMALGIVALCSDIPSYRALHDAGAPIVLVDEGDWGPVTEWIVNDTKARERLSEAGPDWVRSNRDMATTGYKKWQAYYEGIKGGV